MMNTKKAKRSVRYANFHVNNAINKYTLHMNDFSCTLSDALKLHNKQKFSAFDSDNDSNSKENCAVKYFGGWWFADSYTIYVKGKYYSGGKMAIESFSKNVLFATVIYWYSNGFNILIL